MAGSNPDSGRVFIVKENIENKCVNVLRTLCATCHVEHESTGVKWLTSTTTDVSGTYHRT